MKRVSLAAVLMLAGCGRDTWYVSDFVDVDIVGPGRVTLEVTTTAGAIPPRPDDQAVRGLFEGPGSLSAADPSAEVKVIDVDAVNVIDVWDDCPRADTCVREVGFDVTCDDGGECPGHFSADAYLSSYVLEPPDVGTLTLEVVETP